MHKESYPLVIPTIPIDLPTVLKNLQYLKDCLPIDRIYLIGPTEIKDIINESDKIIFIPEDSLVHKDRLIKLFEERGHDYKRVGWYIQQFVKMAFSFICESDYYILWDSDTLPTRELDFFTPEGKPIFDCKTEYHKPYFVTLERILPNCRKIIKGSFISEHMIVKTSKMKEMIHNIESNSSLNGNDFMEKILNAISDTDIEQCGFSEFETYGSFISKYYPDLYSYREWHSMRYGSFFFNKESISHNSLDWLSRHYHAISFEKGHNSSLFYNPLKINIIRKLNPKILDFIALIVRAKHKIFHC